MLCDIEEEALARAIAGMKLTNADVDGVRADVSSTGFFANLKRENVVYAHLTSAICSLALSVRHAACSGHDVSAKILARSLGEYSDVMALLILQPDGTPGGLSTQWCRSRCGAPARRRSRGLLRGREFGRFWPQAAGPGMSLAGNGKKGCGRQRFSRQGTPGGARLLGPRYTVVA